MIATTENTPQADSKEAVTADDVRGTEFEFDPGKDIGDNSIVTALEKFSGIPIAAILEAVQGLMESGVEPDSAQDMGPTGEVLASSEQIPSDVPNVSGPEQGGIDL